MDIRALRHKVKLTQQELADKVGVARSTLAQYESGGIKPSMPVLVRLSKVLGIDLNDMKRDADVVGEPGELYRTTSSLTAIKRIAELMGRIEEKQEAIIRLAARVKAKQKAISKSQDEIKRLLGWRGSEPG